MKKILRQGCVLFIFAFVFITSYVYSDTYKRIISLSTAVTEELYLLGAGDRLAGVTIFCKRPRDAEKKTKVGTVTEVNMEKIMEINPDLVIGTPLTDERQLNKLKDLGINIIRFPLSKNFEEICSQFMELGRIVGAERTAKGIVNKARKRVFKVRNRMTGDRKVSVFVQVGSRPLCTMTEDSFINDYIELAGGMNIAKKSKTVLFNREEVLEKDPDVILIVTMGIEGEKEKKEWERFKYLKAIREKKIYILDSYKICSPTPVSFAKMLEVIAEILRGAG